MYRLGPCIPICPCMPSGSFFIKSAKRMCICEYFKNRIGSYKKCVFRFEKWYKWIIVLDSCKAYCWLNLQDKI